jgi:hypothetical protein
MQTEPKSRQTLPVFDNAQAWYGPQMTERRDWSYQLVGSEIDEIDDALRRAVERGADLVSMTSDDFPLPGLSGRIAEIRDYILHGAGVFLLKGLPVQRYSRLESALAFRGIGAHLGDVVSQNAAGHVLGHVTNTGKDYSDPSTRGYQTAAELRFHTDASDVVGLLCLKPGKSGGLSRVASSTTVWNEMVRRRPDLAAELMQPYCLSRWGEIGSGQQRFARFPLFTECDSRMIAVFIMSAIEKAQDFPEVPRLSPAQSEAMEMANALASDDAIRLDMDFRPGDMQFLLNHATLHSRTAYEDHPQAEQRRHLLRLWLACADGPTLPRHLTTDFQGLTASGRPNGIHVPGVALNASPEPH